MIKIKYCYILLIILLQLSCRQDYTPKPIAYPRIDRPQSGYFRYEAGLFSFLYSDRAEIKEDTSRKENQIWINITYPAYDATIYCTYIPVTKQTLSESIEDSYQLAYSHATMASGIRQLQYSDPQKHVFGLLYEIDGAVAAPIQFYATDSVAAFFRGSLYYNQLVNADSIAPVTQFLKDDIVTLLESLEWKK